MNTHTEYNINPHLRYELERYSLTLQESVFRLEQALENILELCRTDTTAFKEDVIAEIVEIIGEVL